MVLTLNKCFSLVNPMVLTLNRCFCLVNPMVLSLTLSFCLVDLMVLVRFCPYPFLFVGLLSSFPFFPFLSIPCFSFRLILSLLLVGCMHTCLHMQSSRLCITFVSHMSLSLYIFPQRKSLILTLELSSCKVLPGAARTCVGVAGCSSCLGAAWALNCRSRLHRSLRGARNGGSSLLRSEGAHGCLHVNSHSAPTTAQHP